MEIDSAKLTDILNDHCLYAKKVAEFDDEDVIGYRVAFEVLQTSKIFISKLTGITVARLDFFTRFVMGDTTIKTEMRGTHLLFLICAALIEEKNRR